MQAVMQRKASPSTLSQKLKTLYQQGVSNYTNANYAAAKRNFEKLIKLEPKNIGALALLGSIATKQECPEEAAQYFAKVVLIDDTDATHFYNLGHALQQLKKYADALICYEQAIALKPSLANAYSNKASIYLAQYDLQLALDCYQKAIELDQHRLADYVNYALVLSELNMPNEALEVCDIAAQLGASPQSTSFNKGFILARFRRDAEAESSYLETLKIAPDDVKTRWNLSHLYLRHGLFSKGWPLYEARWQNKQTGLIARDYPQPLWLGQASLEGKTIYLYAEQGLGDTIQFCRYAEDVAALGAKVILDIQAPLRNLLANLKGVHALISTGDVVPAFDFHCPLMSLPLALGHTKNVPPIPKQYIQAPDISLQVWAEKIYPNKKLKVGLVWSGGFHAEHLSQRGINSRRNLPLEKLNLFKGLNIDFYSLQKGDPAESELRTYQLNEWDGLKIINHAEDLKDFVDTAALIAHLDLVISVDTSTAHLAGAMGKPVWLLNRFDSCWRWGIEGQETHWYPELKIFWQSQPHHWDDVLMDVAERLRLLAK